MTKKKNVIRPELSQYCKDFETPWPSRLIEKIASQTRLYEAASTFTQMSAATVAARSTAALPVSVRRNVRSGVSRFRAHAVRPENPP